MTKRLNFEDEFSRRWRGFRANKKAGLAAFVLIFMYALSLSAELWMNSKPILFQYQGRWYAPVFKTYSPAEFGQSSLEVNYDELAHKTHRALWPPLRLDPFEIDLNVSRYPSPPDQKHWFGVDSRGRDVLARLIYGFRTTLTFALLVWILSFSLGVLIGGLSGFIGGWLDLMGQRGLEIFEALPVLLILMMLVSIFGGSFQLLVLASVLFSWMMVAHVMRAEFLRLKQSGFVEACRAQGLGYGRTFSRHILPNAVVPLVSYSPFFIAGQISALTTLDYLGLGLRPSTPTWGELLAQGQNNFTGGWWLILFPSLALVVTMITLTSIGAGIRSAFDPRTS